MRRSLLALAALAFAGTSAQARVVTTTITGTLASGYDTTGVFGPRNTDLTGRPFTLIIQFDDTQGAVCCSSAYPSTVSNISATPAQSPGTASLVIGRGQYLFGTGGRSPNNPLTVGANSFAFTPKGQYLGYSITDNTASGQDSLTGYVYPPAGTTFPIMTWEDYFSSTTLSAPSVQQQLFFSIANSSGQVYGSLAPTSIAQPAPVMNPQPPNFASMVILPSGASANGASLMAAVGDFNGDGHQDIATTNTSDSSLSLLYGKGDGTFQPASTFATGRGPYGIAGSGENLYVVNGLDSTFSILGFNGAALQSTATYSVGFDPFGITVGPLDGSPNHVGAVITNTGSNSISVWLNPSSAPVSYQTGDTPFGSVLADFRHIGYTDIAVWDYAGNDIAIFPSSQSTPGSFYGAHHYPAGSTPYGVATGYFNNDGSPDLAVVNLGSNTVSVLLNDNAGSLLPPVAYAVGSLPTSVIAADLNGDSYTDLAVANLGDGTVSVLLGKGDGTFLPQVAYAAGTQPYSLQQADFNGDGRPDLVVSNFFSPTVGVMLQTAPTATSGRVRSTPPKAQRVIGQ